MKNVIIKIPMMFFICLCTDVPEEKPKSTTVGGALGPDWVRDLSMVGSQLVGMK